MSDSVVKTRSNLLVGAATAILVVVVSWNAWAGNPVTSTTLVNMVIFALPLAGIYAMSATGLVVVYTTTGIFNFAQGAIGMFLAYVDWELSVNHGVPQVIAVPLTVLVIAPLLGIVLDRAIMRHLQGKELVVQLIGDHRPDVRVHRPGQHDLGPERQSHAPARCSARAGSTSRA